jgi:hypothetical protein
MNDAVTGQVESWYGACPVIRLIRSSRPVCGTRHLIFESGRRCRTQNSLEVQS